MYNVRNGQLSGGSVTVVSVTATEFEEEIDQDYLSSTETHRYSNRWRSVEVTNVSGSAAIYFRTDDSVPTVAGDDCHVVAAVAGASRKIKMSSSGTGVARLISSGTPTYSVTFS